MICLLPNKMNWLSMSLLEYMDGAGLRTSDNKMYVASRIRVLVLHVKKLMELQGCGNAMATEHYTL